MTEANTDQNTETQPAELIQKPEKLAVIQPNTGFYEILEQIETNVQKGQILLKEAENEEDEDKLLEIQTALKPLAAFKKDIDEARKDVRRMYDDEKKRVDGIFQDLLVDSGYNDIAEIQNESKRLNKEIQQRRKNRQWAEITELYNTLLDATYPNVKTYLPSLTAEEFETGNQSFVSGAKNAKVTKKMQGDVDKYLSQRNSDLNVLLDLKSPFQDDVLRRYALNLDLTDAINAHKRFDEKAKLAEQQRLDRMKREQERVERENKKNEKKAKLTNTEAKKEPTVYMDKMYRIGQVYQKAVNAPAVTEALAKELFNEIKRITNEG